MAMTQAEYEAEVRRRLGAGADAFLRTHPTPQGMGVGGGGAPPSTLMTTTTGLGNQLSSAIDQARSAGLNALNAPSAFSFDELRRAAEAVRTAGGGPLPVPEARFQDPRALMQFVQDFQSLFEPLVQARTTALEADYNRLAQELRNRLAAQGALVGGGAVQQQQDLLRQILRDIDLVRAEGLTQAVPLALQAAQLGLTEAETLFGMQQANRQFELARLQQFFDNLARGMSMEEAARQFRAGLEADLAQNYVQNLLNQMGFEESRRQFDIGTALRMAEMFGISPTMSLPEMFQQAQGQMPLSFRQALAGLTGIDPVTGQPSFAARESELNRALNLFNILGEATGPLAEILGIDPGTRTAQLRLGLLSRAGAGGGGGVSQNEALLQAAYVQARDMFQQGNQQGAFDHLIMSGYSDTAARRIIDTWREFGFDEEDTRIAAQADQLANQLGITFDGGLFILEMRESGWSKARALNELEREPLSPAEKNIIRQFINQEFAEDTPARSGNRQGTIPEIAVPNAPLRFPPSHLPQSTGPARTDIPAGTFFPWFLHIQR